MLNPNILSIVQFKHFYFDQTKNVLTCIINTSKSYAPNT
jgi:hypothetical protein